MEEGLGRGGVSINRFTEEVANRIRFDREDLSMLASKTSPCWLPLHPTLRDRNEFRGLLTILATSQSQCWGEA